MRGRTERQAAFIAVTPEQKVPKHHPIRAIRAVVEPLLGELSPVFEKMYEPNGRPSIPPEHLLKATLLMALYSVRSERQFCERLEYDLLFKWFMDLNLDDPAFDHSTFSKNRQRLLDHDVATKFLAVVVAEAQRRRLLSEEHFTVDGTLLEAWASLKSFRPRDEEDPPAGAGRNPERDFRGNPRKNDTHVSTTDPEARLYTKSSGQAAKLCFMGHLLTENRSGLVLDILVTEATGGAERETAIRLLERRPGVHRRATLGADKAYDTRDFVRQCREQDVTPHVAQNTTNRKSAIDGRVTRQEGYAVSQRKRKRIEEVFGWVKTVGATRKLRYVGIARNQLWMTFQAIAYNLVRIANLGAAAQATPA
ncbi:MAG: IS5 family transposase [Dehalococcoidia bacterium]|nr:IS5 family transposase [Myxococcales bacterium]MCA9846197.1 IS5 family transposase [Dehalococcoidia bacterium]MCB9484669.1 IS5 family transposase [Thermoflexaceae bacterium]MCB9485095.1 IS5 family transposase [Thermoflexaceae bacterium]MCB9485261.1 IS5 family transposase [Thermoflexaceae bacterium]